jgi:hypothetical protein
MTNIVGLIFIFLSSFFFFYFIFPVVLYILIFLGVDIRMHGSIWIIFPSLLLGFYLFFLGSAIRSHKKWSWYVGIITVCLTTTGNTIFFIINTTMIYLIPLIVNLFFLYSLLTEKNLFIKLKKRNNKNNIRKHDIGINM